MDPDNFLEFILGLRPYDNLDQFQFYFYFDGSPLTKVELRYHQSVDWHDIEPEHYTILGRMFVKHDVLDLIVPHVHTLEAMVSADSNFVNNDIYLYF